MVGALTHQHQEKHPARPATKTLTLGKPLQQEGHEGKPRLYDNLTGKEVTTEDFEELYPPLRQASGIDPEGALKFLFRSGERVLLLHGQDEVWRIPYGVSRRRSQEHCIGLPQRDAADSLQH